ncbi:MAG: response regulator, partial [Sphingomicrobium sp.]
SVDCPQVTRQPMKLPRVLVVDDDPLIRLDIEDVLLRLRCQVAAAADLAIAMKVAQSERVDLALLDFDLGEGVDSVPLAETLAQRKVPVVFVSGGDANAIREVFPKARIIGKPISEGELRAIVQRLR